MRLIRKTSQSRRDFVGIYECEKCKHKQNESGYDDRNFHDNVAPTIKCKSCGESTRTLCVDAEHVPTRYAEHTVI